MSHARKARIRRVAVSDTRSIFSSPSSGGGAVTLPWQLTFDSSDPITGGNVPTFDDATWREDGLSSYSVASTPTIDGYNPSTLFDKVLRINPNGTYRDPWIVYGGLKVGGKWIDPSGGLRICVISGTEISDQQHRALGFIFSQAGADLTGGSTDGIYWGASNKNNPDQVNLEYRNDGGAAVDIINWANTATSSTQFSCWMATKIQIPAAFSGTAQIWMKILGDHAAEGSASAAMAGSWADVVFDAVQFTMGSRTVASQNLDLGMIWVGSLTDAWPV